MPVVRRAALLAAALTLAADRPAQACAMVLFPGDHGFVAEERALIIWDGERKVEHFVREAQFEAQAHDFGFLVPTPAPPELAEADSEVFDRLDKALEPEHRVIVRRHTDWSFALPFYEERESSHDPDALPGESSTRKNITNFAAMGTEDDEPVKVVHQQVVAGYDATVLEAKRADALNAWLAEHKYPSSPQLEAWLKPYIEQGWAITAFKIDGGTGRVRGKLVRLSFPASEPFYPYREPAGIAHPNQRTLRMYLVGTGRYDAPASRDWNGPRTQYASAWSELSSALSGAVPGRAVPRGAWLSVIDDRTRERPDSELTFSPSTAGELKPRPIVTYQLVQWHLGSASLAGLALVLAVGSAALTWAARQRRTA